MVRLFCRFQDTHRARQVGDSNPGCQDRCHPGLASEFISLAFTSGGTPRRSGEAISQFVPEFPNATSQLIPQGLFQEDVPNKYSPKQDFGMFFAVDVASGGWAAVGSLTMDTYPNSEPTRFASDVGPK